MERAAASFRRWLDGCPSLDSSALNSGFRMRFTLVFDSRAGDGCIQCSQCLRRRSLPGDSPGYGSSCSLMPSFLLLIVGDFEWKSTTKQSCLTLRKIFLCFNDMLRMSPW